jgi:hypothetical protein
MSLGESRLSAAPPAHLFFGLSWLALYFRPRGKHEWSPMALPNETRTAAVCTRCGGMWVAPRTAPPDEPVR